jgi:hypothetical protein
MPTSEGDLAPFQHARQGRKGRTWVGASREVAQTQLFGAAPRIWRVVSSSRVDRCRRYALLIVAEIVGNDQFDPFAEQAARLVQLGHSHRDTAFVLLA